MSGVERPERRALLVRGGVWRLPLKLHDHCRSQRGHPWGRARKDGKDSN